MAILIPLKLKHRNPNHRVKADGTKVFMAGRFSGKTNNQGSKKKGVTIRPRRRAYGPW